MSASVSLDALRGWVDGSRPAPDDAAAGAELVIWLFEQLRSGPAPRRIHLHYWFSTSVRGHLDARLEAMSAPPADLVELRRTIHDGIAMGINLRRHRVPHVLSAWRDHWHENHRDSSILATLKLLALALIYSRGGGWDEAMEIVDKADGPGPTTRFLLEELTTAFEESAKRSD